MIQIIISLLLMLAGIFNLQPASAQENSLRLEQEGRFLVPQEKTEAVWTWLKDYFVVNQDNLHQFDPALTAYANEEIFTDNYFDTPSLQLLNQQHSVRHRQRENLTNPEDRKSGRELVQIKLSDASGDLTTRQEYKYEVDLVKGPLPDQNPLIGIIKKGGQRDDFVSQLAHLGIEANRLRPILVINDSRRRIYFEKETQPLISLSLDQATTKRLWVKTQFSEIESELNEVTYTASDEAGREYLENINRQILTAIITQFPDLVPDLTPKYNKAFNRVEKKIPFFRWLIRWGLI